MILSRTSIIVFRFMLVISLLLISYLVTTELEHPIMTSVNDKLGHILTFVLLAFLLDFSFPASSFNLSKILPLLAYGMLIEVIQYFLPYRMFSLLDILADGIGLVIYTILIPMLKHVPFLRLRWSEKT
jgi:VanZ family protein